MIKIQIVPKIRGLNGVKALSRIGKNPCKYEILTDDLDCVITRSRRHIKAYLTKSGRMSKPPKYLIEN